MDFYNTIKKLEHMHEEYLVRFIHLIALKESTRGENFNEERLQ